MKYAFTLGLISLALVSAQYEHDENYNNMDNYDDNDFGYYQGGTAPRNVTLDTKKGRKKFLKHLEKKCIKHGPKKIARKEKKCKAKAKKRCTKKLAKVKDTDPKYEEKLTKCIAKKEKKCEKKAAKRTARLEKSCKRMRRKWGYKMAVYFNPSLKAKFRARMKARKAAKKAEHKTEQKA
ncbi:hypothetical protein BB559_006639 [Furculomyces boomerangus]|uniref:Uncharacterized protein n=1 Tax=Furculomyces boomerangus TaxID=61424 RepID=A0A2T9Y1C2_9FUNG|nr:hypothetical protein BB559_006639 [Furculomyces boomerangus]